MKTPNQIERKRDDVNVTAANLVAAPTGQRTEAGLRLNVRVGIQYLEAWIGGVGCVPLYNLMEDAATAEISRTQIWQWLRHGAELEDGRKVDRELVERMTTEEMQRIAAEVGTERFEAGRYEAAATLFTNLCFDENLVEFLTLDAYELLKSS